MAKILPTALPTEAGLELAERVRTLRLDREWPRAVLAERSGVSEATIKLFETGGQITLSRLLLLARALDALGDFDALFVPRVAKTLAEIETRERRRQRGRRRS